MPQLRWWNIAARTAHLLATGVLLGGHVFGEPAGTLEPWLWAAAVSGLALIGVEVVATGHWLHQGCAAAVALKLMVLALVPCFWDLRVALLVVVVGLASVGSHAPRTIRHYSWWYRRHVGD